MASVRLEEFDKECWKRRVVTASIGDAGKRVVYHGEALTSVSGSGGLILEMTVESSWRPVRATPPYKGFAWKYRAGPLGGGGCEVHYRKALARPSVEYLAAAAEL